MKKNKRVPIRVVKVSRTRRVLRGGFGFGLDVFAMGLLM
ncbi:MAG: hypothetical protein ETSY2_35165 [Candidatus Entotheonella gemina]|uniref:Uncharacterized protein n=1 Tax=Candidatus Entotheonella gemina TaxID=1429439 RepID=W4LX01_9BACT|nr:MAG: hypothetical protein ETSY2_35165 [Candidatus Entotheonella gemina]